MSHGTVVHEIVKAWDTTAAYIAAGHEAEFAGSKKEKLVFCHVKKCLNQLSPGIKVDLEVPFDRWRIDLVGSLGAERAAVEGKFKIQSDVAVPDNRKAAFFDLCKLERYVDSGKYPEGLFVWLTSKANYLRKATGDSAGFSTHDGRLYLPGTPLHAKRARSGKPLTLLLTRRYSFSWQQISNSKWYSLVLTVLPTGNPCPPKG